MTIARTDAPAVPFRLIVGERYRFNFPASPSGHGTFLGFLEDGSWIALEDDEGEVTFYNFNRLSTMKPESYPR